jgi:multisubunit Na+/H+ antiporter MnhE subunit
MNNKEGNQKFLIPFVILFIIAIMARNIIHKIRPGTFSVITYQVVSLREVIIVLACALLILTEKLKYFKINLGIYIGVLLGHLASSFLKPEKIEIGDYIAAGIFALIIIYLMRNPITKMREQH